MNESKEQKPIVSMVPFEPLLDELHKLQGDRPALIIMFDGNSQMFFLKHNLKFEDPIMDKIMQLLSINILQSRGFDLGKVENFIKNNPKIQFMAKGTKKPMKKGGKKGC